MRLKIVDLNRYLINSLKESGFNAEWKDYFADVQPNEVLITASNPMWTFGGGIDALFAQKYPDECGTKRLLGGGMERINDIVFSVTVNENYQATPEIVEKAIRFGLSTLKDGEVLRISCLGTGIGGLSKDNFCAILQRIRTDYESL